jgi:AAA family ATP:ADP antiporter
MSDSEAAPKTGSGPVHRLLSRMIDVRPAEVCALGWSWLYIFSVLSSYYILRPIRDEMGVAGGVENLQWLFTGTLLGMIAVNPPFAALVAKLPRMRFIAVTYRFFILNLLLFIVLLQGATSAQNIWIGRVFFIWVSVFNLFVVSVFWAVMVDVFDSEQSKRLFGFIAAGATLGSIMGSSVTAAFATALPSSYLLLVSALLLELAIFGVRRLSRLSGTLQKSPAARGDEPLIGGSIFSGVTHAFNSSYLANVGLYILLFTITSTFLYFQQAEIAKQSFVDRGARTAFFARVDLAVNLLSLTAQLFATARVLRATGVAFTLAMLPALSLIGFSGLALAPVMIVLVTYQVLRRAGNFAFARPTREVLFTVVPREDRYKTKSFLDTVVYRTGDQIGAWSYAGLSLAGLGLAGISAVAIPLSLIWLLASLWLGRRHEKLASVEAADSNTVQGSRFNR